MQRIRQQGQALIYGLFVLTGGLTALFFLFNTGQLVREKTKLVNAADAVAYSVGVMHARALNFEAYTNRAMVANTVAIAQLVSLSSWVQYVDNLATYGIVLDNPKHLPYYPSYMSAKTAGSTLKTSLIDSGSLENTATASDNIIRNVLVTAQQVAYAGLILARLQVMNEVAQANYLNDGTVTVDPIPLTATEFTSFVSAYSGNDRTRFKEVAETAANKDRFVSQRSWSLPALYSDCPTATAMGRFDWLDRRGGTNLIGFDEWKAMDTMSEKRWVPKNKTDAFCQAVAETPAGWGMQNAADNSSAMIDPMHHDMSMIINPGSSLIALATSSSWDYSGMPNFYDLSSDALTQEDPRLRFAVKVRRNKSQTRTSEGTSVIEKSNSTHGNKIKELNDYKATPAGGNELIAVSASEAFFERPEAEGNCASGGRQERDNCYGRTDRNKPREIGSLFNPYWQTRLIQADAEVRNARALQGVVLP